MAEDKDKELMHAHKRLYKLTRRRGIADAAKEIGEVLQELGRLEGAEVAEAAVLANLPNGDTAKAVFSVVKNDELHDLLNQYERACESNDGEEWPTEPDNFRRPGDASWTKCAEEIDRFRDKVSAHYGFSRELIMPVSISDTSDPLRDSTFTVLGIEYAVHNAVLTCVGEVQ